MADKSKMACNKPKKSDRAGKKKMGQTALETALNKLKRPLTLAILFLFFFAGQIICDIGGTCRIFAS